MIACSPGHSVLNRRSSCPYSLSRDPKTFSTRLMLPLRHVTSSEKFCYRVPIPEPMTKLGVAAWFVPGMFAPQSPQANAKSVGYLAWLFGCHLISLARVKPLQKYVLKKKALAFFLVGSKIIRHC